MSSTTYTDFAVFTSGMNIDLTQIGFSLFDDGSDVVVVLSQSYENNVEPRHEKWHCDYIGTADGMLTAYIPKMASYFDSGHARSATIENGYCFGKHITQLYLAAEPIRLRDLSVRGIVGYSWSIEEYEVAKIGPEPIRYEYYSTKRVGYLFSDETDVETMVNQSLMIRKKANFHVWSGRPWLANTSTF